MERRRFLALPALVPFVAGHDEARGEEEQPSSDRPPSRQPNERQPLLEILEIRYGRQLSEEETHEISQQIGRHLMSMRQLDSVTLTNADAPTFAPSSLFREL